MNLHANPRLLPSKRCRVALYIRPMAEPEVHVGETEDSTGEDAEMDGGENTQEEVAENGAANGETEDINGAEEEPAIAVQTTFAE